MQIFLVTSTAHETASIRCWVVANFGTWDDELGRQYENSIQMTRWRLVYIYFLCFYYCAGRRTPSNSRRITCEFLSATAFLFDRDATLVIVMLFSCVFLQFMFLFHLFTFFSLFLRILFCCWLLLDGTSKRFYFGEECRFFLYAICYSLICLKKHKNKHLKFQLILFWAIRKTNLNIPVARRRARFFFLLSFLLLFSCSFSFIFYRKKNIYFSFASPFTTRVNERNRFLHFVYIMHFTSSLFFNLLWAFFSFANISMEKNTK